MSNSSKEVHLHTKGILPVQKLKILRDLEILDSHPDYPINDNQFQPNSLDLRLGEVAYRVRCSFLPENETVEQKIEKLEQYSFSIKDGAVLEENCVYIIPLLERLNLPKSHYSTPVSYTHLPEVAHVGATEKELNEAGTKFETYRFPYSKIDRAVTEGESVGLIKIFAKKFTGKILGASVVGAHAGEFISELSLIHIYQ